ncbi:DUF2637 domain-containing protein [Streptomyces galilaeus]|uniref:DUF2637 domain-containing protein n=2 Tax=Streptomyces galilaeus TaxID=33899 RepID=UPI0038F6F223
MNSLRMRLTVANGVVIIALTAAAFWLSYAHLHDVAAANGLGDSPARAWAWPATLDLFIVAGEIMMLVAALDKRRDLWAVALTVAGSAGSIGLNVYGVGANALLIEYLVAAVPPSAALLAFGALMRQIHRAAAKEEAPAAEPAPVEVEVEVEEAPMPAEGTAADEVCGRYNCGHPMSDHRTGLGCPSSGGDAFECQGCREALAQWEPDADEESVPLFTVTTKPTLANIESAVEDLKRDRLPVSGPNLARIFGVSDRSGRRYLAEWNRSQKDPLTPATHEPQDVHTSSDLAKEPALSA